MEGDLNLGGEHTIQCTNDILWNFTVETYIILLTNVTPINPINTKKRGREQESSVDLMMGSMSTVESVYLWLIYDSKPLNRSLGSCH